MSASHRDAGFVIMEVKSQLLLYPTISTDTIPDTAAAEACSLAA
jgi:hypothetical protein